MNANSLGYRVRRLRGYRRRYTQSVKAITTPEARRGSVEWILSRGLCRFIRFELAAVPTAQRRQSIQLQVKQNSPFVQAEWVGIMQDSTACVWIWDQNKTDCAIAESRLDKRKITIIPETLLQGRLDDGIRLVEGLDGFEAQHWRAGSLIDSRWWSVAPDLERWNSFLRDAGEPAAGQVPAAESVALQETPWSPLERLDSRMAWRHEPFIVMAGLSLMLALITWELVALYRISDKLAQEKENLAVLERRMEPLQKARLKALDLKSNINFLVGLNPYPSQTVLQMEVGKRLPKEGVYVKEWEYRSGKLVLTLAVPSQVQASLYVKNYQDSGWFREVRAVSGSAPNQLVLEMSLLTLQEIPAEMISGKSPDVALPPPGNAKPNA